MPEQAAREALLALRDRVTALRATACAMAHESIPSGPDGMPLRDGRNQSGYLRPGICAAALRADHLGCSHTMARYALREALERVPGDATEHRLDQLRQLEDTISILDHRRYDAECRRADALLAGADEKVADARAEIGRLVTEHRACNQTALGLRDAVLHRLDAALAG